MANNATVLVVDDDPSMLTLIGAILEREDVDVIACSDPSRVVSLAAERQPDAIVLDLMMPRLPGLQVLELLRSQAATRRIPVMILSAKNAGTDRIRGLKAGADDYMTKPFEPEELSIRLRRLIDGSREDPGTVLSGKLGDLAAGDILQQALISGLTGVLELTGTPPGNIAVSAGAIAWARCGNLDGQAALLILLQRREGRFRLVKRPAEAPAGDGKPLSLDGTLMLMAWLEDELERRRHFLPPHDAPLGVGEPAEPPESECGEIGAVLEWYRRNQGASLAGLERSMSVAPQQARLATALLMEAGLLHTEPGVPARVAPEPEISSDPSHRRLEAVCSKLVRRATAMGRPPDILHVLVGVDPERWQGFLDELIGGMSGDLLDRPREQLVSELHRVGSASLRIVCLEATLLLHIHQLSGLAGLRARAFLPMATAVVLGPSAVPRGPAAEIVEATAALQPPPLVLAVPPPGGSGGWQGFPRGWAITETMPSSVQELLELVVQSG
ncbi:MAG: response regulator [Acidobacteria bacterium]|nr:response regulator [Acidobacteriota bacterium]